MADAEKLYRKLKKGPTKFVEKIHCPMIIDVLSSSLKGTVSAFCIKAQISDCTFYEWCKKHNVFNYCYRVGLMFARENWEDEGRAGCTCPEWNLEYWRMIGWSRFGIGKNSRIRLDLKKGDNPNDHYHQLLEQASRGDFTAGEIKQLMEAINVGLNSHQVFQMQCEIDELKSDLNKINELKDVNDSSANKGSEKTN